MRSVSDRVIAEILMRFTDAEGREGKSVMSIVTSTILEEVVMVEPLTLSGSKKRKNTVEEGDGP